MSVFEWDTTAANNATADAKINYAEGQAPSTVNNSARAAMAAEASWLQGIGGALTTAGTGSAYTLTLADAPTAYTTSMLFLVKFHAVSASATTTINVNSLGAKTLKTWDGSALPSADYIPVNAYGLIKYDGTNMRVFLPSIAAATTQANTFTANQTLKSDDAGAIDGPTLILDRNSASPAASDAVGRVRFDGRDSAGNTTQYAAIRVLVDDPTDTSEDGRLSIWCMSGGAIAAVAHFGIGAYMAGATDGDKGAGTFNATTLYEGGSSLSSLYASLSNINTFGTAEQNWGTFSSTGASEGRRLGDGFPRLMDSSTTATTSTSHYRLFNPNGQIGSITTSGTSTAFNTSSDANLKDAVTDADKAAAIAKVRAGRTVEFEFKATPGVKHLGFIAQEMHEVHPEAVTPGDAETPWMMDHSKLVPVLWATVQDLLTRVEALENA